MKRCITVNKINLLFACFTAMALAGCGKQGNPAASPKLRRNIRVDACSLLTPSEIKEIQGSPIKETRGSMNAEGGLRVSQCFYTAAEYSRSVSLSVTQGDPESTLHGSAEGYWEGTFGRYQREEKEKGQRKTEAEREKQESLREQREKEGEEEAPPPKKVAGIGDEAFWSGNRFGGALYVLDKKRDLFIRISVGGSDDEQTKIEKSKKLALKAIERL
jgi:hypothetical protein